jgi:hypothetical protein
MEPELVNLSTEQWWKLRNLVIEAANSKRMPPEAVSLVGHPVVRLIERFVVERQDRFIDEAAKLVALAKPGVDPETALRHYWLVIDKS